ncbi:MAG: YhcH/YjgK/YiaL family protein [Blautia sp.]|nr:YhcH/YjgK/YiaL family protein [Blautia sp.]MDY5030378.1 YhcH/YjgK/YiaL family protein [Blautia sp.]
MIFDRISNLSEYQELKEVAPKIQAFCSQLDINRLEAGRYELDGERLFVIIQNYTTKEKSTAYPESHKKYSDLQLMLSGTERIYHSSVEGLSVIRDLSETDDIIFYENTQVETYSRLTAGTFGFYGPSDAHTPCICDAQPEQVWKAVFKIIVK